MNFLIFVQDKLDKRDLKQPVLYECVRLVKKNRFKPIACCTYINYSFQRKQELSFMKFVKIFHYLFVKYFIRYL